MPSPIIKPEDVVRARMAIQLVPNIHYRAVCHACGWSGTEWNNRPDADQDVRTHACREEER